MVLAGEGQSVIGEITQALENHKNPERAIDAELADRCARDEDSGNRRDDSHSQKDGADLTL